MSCNVIKIQMIAQDCIFHQSDNIKTCPKLCNKIIIINFVNLFIGYIWGWTINSKILQQGNKCESQIQVSINTHSFTMTAALLQE